MNPAEELLKIRNYKHIRARLRYPPNAVPDTGINLKPAPPREEAPPELPVLEPPKPPQSPLLKGLTFSSTLEIIASEFGITSQEIRSRTRLKTIAIPRQIAMYIATTKHHRSLTWVGRYLNLDHTTVIYARNKIKSLILCDPELKDRIDNLENKIAQHAAASLTPVGQSYLAARPQGDVPNTPVPKVD